MTNTDPSACSHKRQNR